MLARGCLLVCSVRSWVAAEAVCGPPVALSLCQSISSSLWLPRLEGRMQEASFWPESKLYVAIHLHQGVLYVEVCCFSSSKGVTMISM